MAVNEKASRGVRARGSRWMGVALASALAVTASEASAYVVVTVDGKVFDVESKPEVRGSLVLFSLDGAPVSLRIYDVNVAKTNELNSMIDRGASGRSILDATRSLPQDAPVDDRLIVGSRLHRDVLDAGAGASSARVVHGEIGAMTSFDSDVPGPRRAVGDRPGSRASRAREDRSPFAAEARQAMEDAQRQVASSRAARASAPPAAAPSLRRGDKTAELDAEIAAEQAYLRRLTAGEVTVDDLDAEIEKSMSRVRKLQKKRGIVGDDAAAPAQAPSEAPEPAAERAGTKWERQLSDKEARLADLMAQRAAATDADDKEALDYLIAETQHQIDKIRKKHAE